MSAAPSTARLAAQTLETIMITFEPYRSPSPGSSAWKIIAKNIPTQAGCAHRTSRRKYRFDVGQ